MTDNTKKMQPGPSPEKFDSWAIVELFGHNKVAGHVSEAVIGGCSFLRVDVPEVPARPAATKWDCDHPAVPAYTRFLTQGAIYSMTPCSEAVARHALNSFRAEPLAQLQLPALPAPDPEDDDDGDDGEPVDSAIKFGH